MSHWRPQVVRELLARHAPEWGGDDEAAEFFGATLRLPAPWLAQARALAAQYSCDDAGAYRRQQAWPCSLAWRSLLWCP